jgi:cytoskeletal protein CcmA (bactofilin family)
MSRAPLRRRMIVVLGVAALIFAPGAASATNVPPREQGGLVVLTGDVHLPPVESVDSIVDFHGSAWIAGRVQGSVVVFSGYVRAVDGAVIGGDLVVVDGVVTIQSGASLEGDIVVVDGLLTVQDGAHVGGDVFSDHLAIAPGAQIDGTTQPTLRYAWTAEWAGAALSYGLWFVLTLCLLAIGAAALWLAPRAAQAVYAAGRGAIGSSIGWGLVLALGLPLIVGFVVVGFVGLPLGFALVFVLALIFVSGMVASMGFLGRSIRKRGSRLVAFVIGWAVVSLAGLVPGLGSILWLAAIAYGLGMLVVAWYQARRGPTGTITVPDQPPATQTHA